MNKMMKIIDLFRIWAHNYFKHPIEEIRTAYPIKPHRLYSSFGNTCKAIDYSAEEAKMLAKANGNKCMLCDFNRNGIPCPLENKLSNDEPVCDHYKYIIIKQQ